MEPRNGHFVSTLSRLRHATWRLSRPAPEGAGLWAWLRGVVGGARAALARGVSGLVAVLGLGGVIETLGGLAARARQLLREAGRQIAGLVPERGRRRIRQIADRLSSLPAQLELGAGIRALRRVPSRIGNWFLSLLYRMVQRQGEFVRRFAKPLAGPSWRLATSEWSRRYLAAAARLEQARPRLVSRLMFRFAQYLHITILGIQLASGQTERSLKLARTLNLIYRHVVRERRKPGCHMYFEALFRTMRFDRIVGEVTEFEAIDDHYLAHQVGVAYLYCLDAERAIRFLERAITIHSGSYIDHRMLGRAFLVIGDQDRAKAAFKRSVELLPITVMAHQNYAGRYDVHSYEPKPFELERAGELLPYDNLGQFAEDLFLQGRFHDSFRYYQKMLDYQREIAPRAGIPDVLIRQLAHEYPSYDAAKPMRLLPYEWVVQFGHIGLLDIYLKMARLGMYPDANYVVLAPEAKVANREFLRYWERYYTIVRDPALVDELFPYQRYIGDNFMAYPAAGGEAEPWTRAGARAQVMWAAQKRGPLLSLLPDDRARGLATLRRLGVPEGAWYVGLHVREAGFYAEASSGISTHRNSAIEDYLPAVEEITRRGGYVIRLGDKSMRPLAPMPGVIDYAVGEHKSAVMDLFLIATSRFVIGTTSGLTTAALAFGSPMVLVNCISNDWQLWSGDTDFAPKRLRERRTGRGLSLGETYRQPIQGYLINNVVTSRRGYVIESNTAEEITAAVRYKLDLLDGIIERPDRNHPLIASYWREMADNPHMFGAAQPVLPFLQQNRELLGASASGVAFERSVA